MKKNNKITLSKSELLKEHKRLLNVLKNPTKAKLLKEYMLQKKELPEYR